ncbi:MAG: hypothetical protein U0175_25785 [Caldilineaceae bacterium]
MKKTIYFLLLTILLSSVSSQVGWAQSANDEPAPSISTPEADAGAPFRLLLPLIVHAQTPYVDAAAQTDTSATTLLADGQFVDGPNLGDFDVERYLTEKQSPLLPYASHIVDKASYYSVNPRLLLTLIEMIYPSSVVPQNSAKVNSLPLDGPALDKLMEDLLMSLTEQFYGQLYGRNLAVESAGQYRAPQIVTFADGDSSPFVFDNNPATDAIQFVLASHLQQSSWQRVAQKNDADGFVATYRRLFPESDPLDDSNLIHPDGVPPEGLLQAASAPPTMLKFPFAAGETWRFTGGPHAYNGCTDNVFSAIDFAPFGYSGCSDPVAEDRWITAPADGTVNAVTCGGCNVSINHGNGWGTRVYHVVNPQVVKGEKVNADTVIGNPSCAPMGVSCGACGGSATGVHQHIDLRYNGAFVPIEGTQFEGWTVHGEACYQGYLEKDGKQIHAPAKITSMPDRVVPTATLTITSELGLQNWYRTPVILAFGGVDDRSNISEIDYRVQPAGQMTAANWLQSAGSRLTITIESDGIYSVSAQVKDAAGNSSPMVTLTFQLDHTPPSNPEVTETACGVINGNWQNSCSTPTFHWAGAEDQASGIAAYEVSWDSGSISTTLSFSNSITSYTPPAVKEGEHLLWMRTGDQAGNWSDWSTVFTLRYDISPPIGTLALNGGATMARTPLVTVSSELSDTLSEVNAIRLRNNGGKWSEWYSATMPLDWPLIGSNGEEVVVEAELQDAAGNLSAIISDTIWLDTQVAQATSTRFRLVRSVGGTTESTTASGRYKLKGSLGQTFAQANTHSSRYQVASGYWRAALVADLLPAPTRTPPVEELPCTITINNGAAFTRQNEVTVTMSITQAAMMRVATVVPAVEDPWQSYTDTAGLQFDTPADQIVPLTAYARFRSLSVTLCRGSVISDTIIYDPLPPVAQIALTNQVGDNTPRDPSGSEPHYLHISALDQSDGSGVAAMQLSQERDFYGVEWQDFNEWVPLPAGAWATLYVRVRDHAGNTSAIVEVVNPVGYRVFLPLLKK